jgi:hypothetical protein
LHNGKKILIIKDSYVLVVAPFLALGIEDIELLDLRRFPGSLKEYVMRNQPDMVIVMYNPSALDENYDNHHFAGCFDFR